MNKQDLKEWHHKNNWFCLDEYKTSHALLIHTTLVQAGISPKSKKYLHLIDFYMDCLKHMDIQKESDKGKHA